MFLSLEILHRGTMKSTDATRSESPTNINNRSHSSSIWGFVSFQGSQWSKCLPQPQQSSRDCWSLGVQLNQSHSQCDDRSTLHLIAEGTHEPTATTTEFIHLLLFLPIPHTDWKMIRKKITRFRDSPCNYKTQYRPLNMMHLHSFDRRL